MPRFFFNIRNGSGFTQDEEGRELPGPAEARAEAIRGIRSLLAEEAEGGEIDLRGRIEVSSSERSCDTLFEVPFGEALGFRTGPLPGETAAAASEGGSPEIGAVMEHHLGLIGRLDPDDVAALYTLKGEIRDVVRGDDLLVAGEDHPRISVIVIRGLLYRYTLTPGGKRQIHSFYLSTDTPSLETLMLDYMDNNLAAAAPSRVAVVPHSELLRVMADRPNLLKLIWRETLVQAAIVREWLARNSQMLAHVQLAHFFCEMLTRAEAAGIAEGDGFDLPITQEDLADALGMTAVHVNRTLTMLRTGGLVEFRGGRVSVWDRERLSDIAEFDAAYLHHHKNPAAIA
ncbi:MAG TPA: Crp/Fnr family transcriptional regulator [Allosphingosinicella sp.]|jgi:CRP-like cAMP-binding protein